MPTYLYLRPYNFVGQELTGADLRVHGLPGISDLYGDPMKDNSSVAEGGNRWIKFRAANQGQRIGVDDEGDMGAQIAADQVRVRSFTLLHNGSTDLSFAQTIGVLAPAPAPPPRATVIVNWSLRNDEAADLIYHDLYFLLFEHNGNLPNDSLKQLVRRLMRGQPDPIMMPLSVSVLSASGAVTFEPEMGTLKLGSASEVQFQVLFAMDHQSWHAYPVVTASAARNATPPNQRVEFAQMWRA